MKLKATKTLAKLLNGKSKYTITCEQMTPTQFEHNVDLDCFEHEIDYNWQTNKYNVICIAYPQNYFACNRYITTKELYKIYEIMKKRNTNNFVEIFNEYVEI